MNLVKDCIIGILILLLKLQSHWLKKGNTVIAIEHNKQYITEADKIIELGPVGGPKGGYLIKDSTTKKDYVYNIAFKESKDAEKSICVYGID